MPPTSATSIALIFDLGPRCFRIWSDPLFSHTLAVRSTEAGAPLLTMTLPVPWIDLCPALLIPLAEQTIISADREAEAGAERKANSGAATIHYLPPRQAAGHRDDCPTCHGFAAAYRRTNGKSCPDCLGTGFDRGVPKAPTATSTKTSAKRKPLSLTDIGL